MGFHMSDRRFVTYSKEFKEMAAKLYLEGGKSYKTLIEELGIKDTKTLRTWVGKYQRGETGLLMRARQKDGFTTRPPQDSVCFY